jgi:hypothetical protein
LEGPPVTERIRISFEVKEFPGGQPWICLEPVEENLKVLARGSLGFDLPRGTTIEAAKKIAEFLGKNITRVSYTEF